MRYSDLFAPIEAFSAYLMKNISSVVEKCNFGEIDDFSIEYIYPRKGEELSIMRVSGRKGDITMICQLFNFDKYGIPFSSLKMAKKIWETNNDGRIVVVCPGIYPQIIDNMESLGFDYKHPIDFLVVDGDKCEYYPFNVTNGTKKD